MYTMPGSARQSGAPMTSIIEDELDHGNPTTYAVKGCRCPLCTEAWGVSCRVRNADRKARLEADPTLAVHGKASTYQNWGCRCTPCRLAATVARAKSREKKEAKDLWAPGTLTITTSA